MTPPFNIEDLFAFVDRAGKSTYASGKPPKEQSERKDFIEYDFVQNEWSYLDSYTGHSKAAGQEVVRYNNAIVWINAYCGGMTDGNEALANDTFAFLKDALSQDEEGFTSLRGPHHYRKDEWEYTYSQDGEISNFSGYEEISYKGRG